MVNILIIEDNLEDKNILINLLSNLFKKECIQYSIKWSKSVIKNLSILHEIDILFLDVEIGDKNGIEYAKEIRKQYPNILVIITSNYPQYLIDGYTVDAKRYFLKPINQDIFDIEMRNVLQTSFKQSFGFYDLKISKQKIVYNSIYYIEFIDRITNIHLSNSTVLRTPYTLKYWIDKLHDKGFSQPYRSFIVNLNYVSGFTKDGRDVLLINNERVPISKHFKKHFENDYYENLSRII